MTTLASESYLKLDFKTAKMVREESIIEFNLRIYSTDHILVSRLYYLGYT